MKRSIEFLFLFGAATLITTGKVYTQTCEVYIPTQINTVIEQQSFDAKDKLTGSTTTKVTDVSQNGTNVSITVEGENFDAKHVSISKNKYTYKCENGVFIMDMKDFIDPKSYEGIDETSVAISGENLAFPANLQVGQALNDGSIKMDINAENGMVMVSTEIRMYNRKVDAIEDITTPAGTFTCYKISYSMDTKAAFFKMTTKGITWYCKNIGAVKSESYDANGKLLSYTQISKITK